MKIDINKMLKIIKIIFIAVFLIILFKFFLVTTYYSAGYTNLAQYQTDVVVENPMPRGEIYDVKDRLIVGNVQTKNLIYMTTDDIDEEYEWEVAKRLSENINMDKMDYEFHEVDYQDLIIQQDYSQIYSRLDPSIEYKDSEITDALRKEVTKEDYNKLKDKYGEDVIKLKILMNSSSTASPVVLFEDLSPKEFYYVETNHNILGGSFVIDSWEREYPYGNTLRNFLGTIGDIPKEDQQKYSNLGYSPSDKVGISYIEKQQEQYLKSTPQQIKIYFDENGNISDYNTAYDGEVGKDLKLTIDIELQKEVEKILKDNLDKDEYEYFKTNYASIMEVNTGNIIVIAGQYVDNKKDIAYDNSIGNFSTAYEIGSVVKPAILLMGYKEGVWDYGQVVVDKPMNLGGGTIKGSYIPYGPVDEYTAIGHSSNVYFYTMALKIAGIEFEKDPLPQEIDKEYFTLLRNNFAQLGLGVETGIDFPQEIDGVKANDHGVGLYMDMANGQYDTYTPLQVTQYISTLANGTTRYKANYLYSINEPGNIGEIGKEIIRINPEVLNYLDFDPKDIDHVQDTLQEPSKSYGTTGYIADPRYNFASKSGTSESFYYEEGMEKAVKTNNTSFMAYAPYNNPKIGLSVLMPYWTKAGDTYKDDATKIGGEILDACYDAGYI